MILLSAAFHAVLLRRHGSGLLRRRSSRSGRRRRRCGICRHGATQGESRHKSEGKFFHWISMWGGGIRRRDNCLFLSIFSPLCQGGEITGFSLPSCPHARLPVICVTATTGSYLCNQPSSFPRTEPRTRCVLGAGTRDRQQAASCLARRSRIAQGRSDLAARRFFLWRLFAHRRDGGTCADYARGKARAAQGVRVWGICNGFQILWNPACCPAFCCVRKA